MTAILSSVLAVVLAGCAGGSVKRIEESKILPTEVTPDLANRFEVRENLTPTPAPVVQITPLPEVKKGRKKKAAPQAAPAPAPAFAYPNRRPVKDPIWVGEQQVFDLSYFGVSAGTFTLDVLPFKEMNGRKIYHARGLAQSSAVFSLFYRLNDTVESYIDYEGMFSHRFHIQLDETKQTRDSLELNDSEKKQTFFWNRWNHYKNGYSEVKNFAPIEPFSQDTLSALFYIRTLPLKDGDVVNIPVISEAKTWTGIVTVMGREMKDTPFGRVRCIQLRPEAQFQGVLKKQGDSFMWLTDDDRRFLVRLEAKVKIGTMVAALKQVKMGNSPDTPQPAGSPAP